MADTSHFVFRHRMLYQKDSSHCRSLPIINFPKIWEIISSLLAFRHHTADSGFCNFNRLPQLIIAKPKIWRVQLSNMWRFVSYFSKNKYVNMEKTDSGFCSYRSPFPLTFPKYWKAFERHLKVAPPESSKIHDNDHTITHSHTLTSEKQNSLLCQPLQASLKNLGGGGASPRGRLQ